MSDAVWSAQGAVGPEGGEVFSPPHCSSATVGDWISLLKPRVILLVVFTGLVGLWVAPGRLNPVLAIAAILAIAVGAGAAGAINMWYDRDIDTLMRRTRRRPIPAGRIAPDEALSFGIALAAASVGVLGLATNFAAALVLAVSIAFYVVVYTMWLKRRTPQNIVIGGAAGAFPPLIGWVAVTGHVAPLPLVLFAIIFFWTPPHFWALAMKFKDDYASAGVPMLPVVATAGTVARKILVYSYIMVAVTLALVPYAGLIYGVSAGVLGAWFLTEAHLLRSRVASGERAAPMRLFHLSIAYLTLLFGVVAVAALVPWRG